jgi:hypothetical protein
METWTVVGDREGPSRAWRGFGEALERLWALIHTPRWRGADKQVMQEVLRPRMQPCSSRKLKIFEFVRSCITGSC